MSPPLTKLTDMQFQLTTHLFCMFVIWLFFVDTKKRRTGAEVLLLLEGDVSDIDLSLEESDDEADAIQAQSLDRNDSRAAIPQTSAVGIELVTESVDPGSQCDSSEDEDDMPLASRIRQQQQTEPAVGRKQPVTPKWKYRDIANVDVTSSSTFTTPKEIGTPLYYFQQFVDGDMINNLTYQTNLYSV